MLYSFLDSLYETGAGFVFSGLSPLIMCKQKQTQTHSWDVFPSAVYSYLYKNTSGGLCASSGTTHHVNSEAFSILHSGSSADCILNVTTEEEIFSLGLAEHIVLPADHIP